MESYITDKKKLYNAILEFIENSDEDFADINNDYISPNIKHQLNDEDHEEMEEFLLIIKNICDHHHRDDNFIKKTKQLLLYYQDQIKQTFSNNEIFHIFNDNKLLVLFLLKSNIITMSDTICEEMMNNAKSVSYCHFFYSELEHFLGEEKMKDVKKYLLNHNPNFLDNYEEKRQEGENESYICSLIRNDSVEEFIAYVNRHNISLFSIITPSIFETNPFLIDQTNISLIEYSAFFGSIQIFQYLKMNNVELTPSLWLYAIHSKNAELIHLLEENNVYPPTYENEENDYKNKYLICLIESIKCHHNDFSDYIKENLLHQDEKDSKLKKEIISNSLKYHNYFYFKSKYIKDYGFFYLCLYNYNKLVDILLKEKEREINLRIIRFSNIFIKN